MTDNYQPPSLDIDIASRLEYHSTPKKQYLYESRDVVPIYPSLPITDDTEIFSFDVQPTSDFIDLREVREQGPNGGGFVIVMRPWLCLLIYVIFP